MEGVFLFRPELVDYWDLKVFLDVDFSASVRRALNRDGYYLGTDVDIRRMYEERYMPGQMLYFSTSKPKEKADIVVDNNDFENPRILHCREKLIL
jgi:uridine kinase